MFKISRRYQNKASETNDFADQRRCEGVYQRLQYIGGFKLEGVVASVGQQRSGRRRGPGAASGGHYVPPAASDAAPAGQADLGDQVIQHAGRIRHFYSQWRRITKDNTILSWVKDYCIPFSEPIQQPAPLVTRPHNIEEDRHFCQEIQRLLSLGVIRQCLPSEGQFVSKIFLRDKPNGEKRLILNLKPLNQFIQTSHFKLEDLRSAVKLILKDCYMCTIDLKDAYFLVNIAEKHRKFLRFQYKSQLFEYTALPFGLNVAPFVFTKLMKPVMQHLRSLGYLSVYYLDDILLIGKDYNDCKNNLEATENLLKSLGFVINYKKCLMTPNKSCTFLGFNINSENFTISLPSEKRSKIKNEVLNLQQAKMCTIRSFARMLGLLTSACPAVAYGWSHTKLFERVKYLNLKNNEDYDKIISIPDYIQPDFQWWLSCIDKTFNLIRKNNFALEIYSDASATGWGASCGSKTANGHWSPDESKKHINELELIAAFFALKIFSKNIFDSEIVMRIDNNTAISYVNRMGGVQFPHLNTVARQIWDLCESHNNFVFASYIASADNTVADAESRKKSSDTEWELQTLAYKRIVSTFSCPEIDLFASRLNHKCARYASWHGDPEALFVDAFTENWRKYFFYAFPPFCLMLKVLSKIMNDKATGIVVAPHWPNQPWFPLFHKLRTSELLILDASPNLLSSPCRQSHPLHKTLSLMVGVLCGRRL